MFYVRYVDVLREQVVELYQSHHVLIFPVIWDEPFSRTLLEAMACGCLVIASNRGSNEEIVKNWENGILYESPREVVRIFDMAIKQQARLRLNAKKWVNEHFSFQ